MNTRCVSQISLLAILLLLSGCSDPPKVEESPTTKVLNRLYEAKQRYRQLPEIKPEQIVKKGEINKNYFTPIDLENATNHQSVEYPSATVAKMNKLLDDAEKEMDKISK
jgi:hypothetical protein